MIDIHSHILWGLDDGAQNPTISMDLARIAADHGTTAIFATPHVLASAQHIPWETITAKTAELNADSQRQGINLTVYPGAELEMNWDMVDLIKDGHSDYCLAGSDYLLVELPFQTIPPYADEFIYQMQLRGKNPIIAHPARHMKLMAHPEILRNWLDKGVLLQCNGGSFTGFFGKHVQANAQMLLRNNMVHFIGSDAHRVEGRNTNLTGAKTEIIKLAGTARAEELMDTNPQKILDNKVLIPTVPDVIQTTTEKKGFWSKLFHRE
jgi:protein-tyrosine phosphatase